MLSSRIRAGVRAGLIAAAATAGAIIGFGIRHDDWSGPFGMLGAEVTGAANPRGFLLTAVGMAVHVSWMVIWGVAFMALAQRRSTRAAATVALLVGVVAALASWTLVPAALGAVQFAALPGVQSVLCIALMAAGLVAGRAVSTSD